MQAACALAQMDRVEEFIAKRRANFTYLRARLASVAEFLHLPEATPNSEPSWFGFPLIVKPSAGIKRVDLINFLEENKIGTRLLFAGNLVKQPYMVGRNYRISGDLTNTDIVMNQTFWLGTFPALGTQELDFITNKLEDFANKQLKPYLTDEQFDIPKKVALMDDDMEIVDNSPPELLKTPKARLRFKVLYVGDEQKGIAPTTLTYADLRHNEALHDYLRKNKKYDAIFSDKIEQAPDLADEVPDEVLLEMEVKTLRQVIDKIPEGDRIILFMKYQDDLPIKDIAEILQKTESAVKMQIKRAKAKAQKIKEDLMGENPAN
jgi:RNA polymerase sigma factor (sigma-70 family)